MKRFLAATLVLVATSVSGQEIVPAAMDLARTLALEAKEHGKARVAVSTFRDHLGEMTPFGVYFAEEVYSQLLVFKGENLTVVERSRTDAIFAEQQLGIDGLRESGKLDAFVKILQVDALMVGTITQLPELGDRMRINARLIAVPNGEGLASASVYVPLTSLPNELPSVPPPTSSKAGPLASRELKGVTYELIGCTKIDRAIMCQVIATNVLADKVLSVVGSGYAPPSRLYDQRGYLFNPTRFVFGDVDDTRLAKKFLISEIPTSLRIYFEGVPPSIKSIKILQVGTSDGLLEFRDIQLVDDLEGGL